MVVACACACTNHHTVTHYHHPVDSLWDVATGKLHQVISGSLRDCQNPDHFLRIKELMITFIQTMETYSYSVVRLIEVVMTFFERYSDLMRDQAAKRCLEAVQADEGNPLTVHSIVDYRHTMEIFKYQEDGATHATAGAPASVKTERLHFPITFPFSSSFIECCDETVQFIEGFYRFGEGMCQH